MVIINEEWLTEMNTAADKAEQDHSVLHEMTNEQLAYLAYWNWGYSGANVLVTKAAIELLAARGIDYLVLGEEIEELAQQYY